MSNVPYYMDRTLLPLSSPLVEFLNSARARTGLRLGDGKIVDGLVFDGLWDVYNDFHMVFALSLPISLIHRAIVPRSVPENSTSPESNRTNLQSTLTRFIKSVYFPFLSFSACCEIH